MHPLTILFSLFLLVPMIEIYLLIKVGGVIGVLPTMGLVVFTAVLGAALIRIQGFSTVNRIRETMARGGIPAIEMIEGAILLLAGALLLTPGFFTDTIGFLCLIPPLRRLLIQRVLLHYFQPINPSTYSGPGGRKHHPDVIEGEYRREDDRN